MDIIVPARLTHEYIKNHPEYIFVYGQDYSNKGFFGQAFAAGHEPNTFPVATLAKICNSASDKYFDDRQFEFYQRMIDETISKIPTNEGPIITFPKIGEGHSELKWKAPLLFKYLHEQLDKIKYPHIKRDYTQ